MAIKAFRKSPQETPEVSALSIAIDDYTRQLTSNPLLDQVVIRQIQVSTTKVDIPHSLGRRWLGWVLTRNNAAIIVYEAPVQAAPEKYISLVATGSGAIDISLF